MYIRSLLIRNRCQFHIDDAQIPVTNLADPAEATERITKPQFCSHLIHSEAEQDGANTGTLDEKAKERW